MAKPEHSNDRLAIRAGSLGPVPACSLVFRPLTVLLGAQGTGKSLVAQSLYFFRDLRRIVQMAGAEFEGEVSERMTDANLAGLVATALDGLRSPHRRFAVFANPKATVEYTTMTGGSVETINLQGVTRQAKPNKKLLFRARDALAGRPLKSRALFLPAERLLYSQLVNATSMAALRLPSTFIAFAGWMEVAAAVMEDWPDGVPDTEEGRWVWAHAQTMLGGAPYRHHRSWKWKVEGSGTTFDIDMASSGQRANWPLAALAAALFSLRARKQLVSGFTLFVEEPEIHVHPRAQRVLTEILAFLVRHGFRVIVTTHSLVGVYVLNNLLRSHLLPEEALRGVPRPELRLDPDDVEVYLLEQGRAPRSIVDRAESFIDEAALGSVADELGSELARIDLLLATQGGR